MYSLTKTPSKVRVENVSSTGLNPKNKKNYKQELIDKNGNPFYHVLLSKKVKTIEVDESTGEIITTVADGHAQIVTAWKGREIKGEFDFLIDAFDEYQETKTPQSRGLFVNGDFVKLQVPEYEIENILADGTVRTTQATTYSTIVLGDTRSEVFQSEVNKKFKNAGHNLEMVAELEKQIQKALDITIGQPVVTEKAAVTV